MSDLPPIVRPGGKLYRPRKLVAHLFGEDVEGVVVLGSHDPELTRGLAAMAIASYDHGYQPVHPRSVWWRLGYECGELRWLDDPVRGRAGVVWELAEQ